MKVEAILFGLILIGILFCLPNHSQAYVGPPYFDRLGHPDEHPWQHDESPGIQDSLDHPLSHKVVVILPGYSLTKAILLIQTPGCSTGSGEKPAEVDACQRDKQHFHGKR